MMWCWHKWKVTGYTPVDIYGEFGGSMPIRHKTDVSMICERCGMPKVHTIRGNWTP